MRQRLYLLGYGTVNQCTFRIYCEEVYEELRRIMG